MGVVSINAQEAAAFLFLMSNAACPRQYISQTCVANYITLCAGCDKMRDTAAPVTAMAIPTNWS